MKILLVHVDKYQWASNNRALALKKQWLDDEVDIAFYQDLPSGDNYDVIHFLFSGGISRAKDYILKYKNKTFTALASQRTLDQRYDKIEDLKQIYKQSVCCVALNPTLADQLKKLIDQDNVVYIPNGVDEKKFDRKFVVGFSGARWDKGDHKGYELVKKACDDLGLEMKMSHSGHGRDIVDHDTMPEFYKSIDCLVLASASEGCNNPTLEALAMNKPVISTKVGIAQELEGVTVVDRDVESIKLALRKLSGRIQILENYTWQKIAKQYHSLYEKYEHTWRS